MDESLKSNLTVQSLAEYFQKSFAELPEDLQSKVENVFLPSWDSLSSAQRIIFASNYEMQKNPSCAVFFAYHNFQRELEKLSHSSLRDDKREAHSYFTQVSELAKNCFDNVDEAFIKDETNDKPLVERERETLLVIIAALAKEAKIDIEKISKAGDLIANMTQLIGAPIGATTIETHLKKINQAISNRTK